MLKGIDVSHHNGEINWPKVDDEIKFVFVKATEGIDWTDDHFHKNVSGAKTAKKKVGAYHFARFNDVNKAKAEALHFLSVVGEYDLDFHILDIEVGSGDLTEESQAFFDVLKEHNRKGLILYTYSNFLKNHFSHDLAGIKLWIAHYGVKQPSIFYWASWDIWQHTSDGSVNGISGRVDLNLAKDNFIIEQLDYVKPKPKPKPKPSSKAVIPYPGDLFELTHPYMKGDDVKRIQHALNVALGKKVLVEDGIFGPKTRDEVKDYQDRHHLHVDGIVGPNTWNTLF